MKRHVQWTSVDDGHSWHAHDYDVHQRLRSSEPVCGAAHVAPSRRWLSLVFGTEPARADRCTACQYKLNPAVGWLIWSFEHGRWWGPDEAGYVSSVADAGVYTAENTLEIIARCEPGNEIPVRRDKAADGTWPATHHRTRAGLFEVLPPTL